jgi:hypothetical protein
MTGQADHSGVPREAGVLPPLHNGWRRTNWRGPDEDPQYSVFENVTPHNVTFVSEDVIISFGGAGTDAVDPVCPGEQIHLSTYGTFDSSLS